MSILRTGIEGMAAYKLFRVIPLADLWIIILLKGLTEAGDFAIAAALTGDKEFSLSHSTGCSLLQAS